MRSLCATKLEISALSRAFYYYLAQINDRAAFINYF